ncbi:MAG: DnaJ domain-containing protein [Chthoniobacteraceae bacterium]
MTDYFALLQLPRSAALDEAALRESFHRLASNLHPDVVSGDANAFTELNGAFTTLRDPAKRLRHLLELELPEALAAPAAIPSEMSDLFPIVGQARAAVVAAAVRRTAATTALSRALLAPAEKAARDLAADALETIRALRAQSTKELDSIASDFQRLPALHQRFSFLGKWEAQLRGALLRLEIG